MSDGRADLAQRIVEVLPGLLVDLQLGASLDITAGEVTARQLTALMLVHASGDSPLRAGEFARLLGVSKPSATALVDRLVERGLLRRDRTSDRRVVLLSLGRRGQALMGALMSSFVERVAQALASMDRSARTRVEGAISEVAGFARRVSRVGGPPPKDAVVA